MQKGNKKVRNATPLEYKGISFKSQLEKTAYVALKEAGFPVKYEPIKFTIWEGLKPTVPFYNKDSRTRMLKQETKKMLDITYTPDFVFYYKNHMIIVEVKGMENDVFPLKKKMFRKWLEEHNPNSLYFEIYSKKHLLQAIDIINKLN